MAIRISNLLARNGSIRSSQRPPWSQWNRWMTKSRRVQDRSSKKRVHDLEITTERWKVVSKILAIMEVLKKEPEQVIPVRNMEQYRQQINLSKPHRISDFLRKSPKLFELYRDSKGVLWCGFTRQAEDLVEEEAGLIEEHTPKAVEYVTRLLMMSVDKRLPVEKIAHFRRDIGLPFDFRIKWVRTFPEHFRLAMVDGVEHLKLTSWNPEWAITEIEKKATAGTITTPAPLDTGMLCLPFPMKFPPNYKKLFRIGGKIEHFQKRSYVSPYADAGGLTAGSEEFDKRAVAVMHEILSFTLEKRLVTDFLTHFRQEFVMPQKLMRLLLKHFGIFYVSERGKRFSVFLTEAYEGYHLIEKCPLVLWKEKVLGLTGYRGRKTKIGNFKESLGSDEDIFFSDESDAQNSFMEAEDGETSDSVDGAFLTDDGEMDIEEL